MQMSVANGLITAESKRNGKQGVKNEKDLS